MFCKDDDKHKVVWEPEEELLIQVWTGTVDEGVCQGGVSSLKNQKDDLKKGEEEWYSKHRASFG